VSNIRIAIVNACTVLRDEEILPVVAALQRQVLEHFAPAYGYAAELFFVARGKPIPEGYSQLVILDTSDDSTALGYHDLTSEGYPQGKSFAKSDLDGSYSWTVTLSHELLELLLDPDLNLCAQVDAPDGHPVFYGLEICDPVENDACAYEIDGIKVSDFVLPAYYEGFHKEGKQYDYCNLLKRPCPELLPDGYISFYDPTTGRGWQERYSEQRGAESMRPRIGSRRERRRTPREQWRRSII
jgi:hypothetical protein